MTVKSTQPSGVPPVVYRNPSQEAYLRLLTTASHLARQVDELLRRFDISQPQYNVLRILAGAAPEGLGRNEIANRMITAMPDMTRLLNRMADKGWIIRQRSELDRREFPTTLTPVGRRLLQSIDAPLTQLHRKQFATLPPTDLAHLRELLKTLATSSTS